MQRVRSTTEWVARWSVQSAAAMVAVVVVEVGRRRTRLILRPHQQKRHRLLRAAATLVMVVLLLLLLRLLVVVEDVVVGVDVVVRAQVVPSRPGEQRPLVPVARHRRRTAWQRQQWRHTTLMSLFQGGLRRRDATTYHHTCSHHSLWCCRTRVVEMVHACGHMTPSLIFWKRVWSLIYAKAVFFCCVFCYKLKNKFGNKIKTFS